MTALLSLTWWLALASCGTDCQCAADEVCYTEGMTTGCLDLPEGCDGAASCECVGDACSQLTDYEQEFGYALMSCDEGLSGPVVHCGATS